MSALLLAVSLSMDALGIGVSYGLRGIKTSLGAKVVICLVSVVFTAAALFFGHILLLFIPGGIAKALGALMLVGIGIYIVCTGLFKKPESFDADCSRKIETGEALYLGIALSVDSFGAGVGYAVTGTGSYFTPLLVGAVQLLFLCGGIGLGKKVAMLKKIPSRAFNVFSGMLLISIACMRVFL